MMKLLWDAIGTEFGGRHELYEMNYAGNHEDIRIQAMWNARTTGTLDGMIALADQCLSDYDENGWCGDTWLDPDDVAYPGVPGVETRRGVDPHELDRPTSRRRHGRRLHGRRARDRTHGRARRLPRSDEPAGRRRPRHHHRRPGRQGRRDRDGGLLGLGCAAHAAGVPQPPQPDQSGRGGERRVLRQHARRTAARRSPTCSPGAPACPAAIASPAGNG